MHSIRYHEFNVSIKKDEIEVALDQICEQESDWGSGLPKPIQWKDQIFECYNDAVNWIEANDYDYAQIAVMYKSNKAAPESKQYQELVNKWREAKKKYEEVSGRIHYAFTTTDYVGCKNCGSRYKRELLIKLPYPNACPLCHMDMRPETTLKQIERCKQKYDDLEIKCKERSDYDQRMYNQKNPGTIKWLVKTEWHE